MDNQTVAIWIGTFLLGNTVAIALFFRWAIARVIDYTHLQRDVKELQKAKLDQDEVNKKNEFDHKGLSIKLDNIKKEKL